MAKIPENVLNVLGECRADGNLLYLPSVQLDRKTYTEVNKVLENMGGKWNRKAKAHVFAEDDDVAEMLENVMLTQEVKDLKREYQFFPTPRAVAERMCEMAEIDSASEVLEPSCGNGQLADVIWEHLPAGMCCIELNTDMKRYLSEKPYGVNYRDFLDVTKKEIGTINRVVMNPPFTHHQDIDLCAAPMTCWTLAAFWSPSCARARSSAAIRSPWSLETSSTACMLRRSSWSRERSVKAVRTSLPASSRSESRCKTRIERFQLRAAILSSSHGAPEDVEPCSTLWLPLG